MDKIVYIPIPSPEHTGAILKMLPAREHELVPNFKKSVKFPELVFVKMQLTEAEARVFERGFAYDYRMGTTETVEELFSKPYEKR